MANKKLSSLDALGAIPAVGDILAITDVSDTTGSAQGTTKKVTVANLVAAAPQGDLLASNNLSDVANAGTSRTNLGLGTAATSASTDFSSAFFNIVTKTANYTLTNAENGKVIFCNSSSRIDITVPSGLTSGFNCRVVQGGAGRVLFVTSGTTINGYTSGSDAPNAVIGQHGVADLVPTGTNIYSLHGDINYLSLFNNTTSVSFDGSNDYISTGLDVGGASALSVSAWVKHDSLSTASIVTQYVGSGNRAFRLAMYPTTATWAGLRLDAYNSSNTNFGTNIALDPVISSGVWYHAAFVFTGSDITVYYNGNASSTVAMTGVLDSVTRNVDIGSSGGSGEFISGNIDEVAIFNSALSASDISTLRGGASAGTLGEPADISSLNPAAWWRMGDGSDGSGNADGTLVNVGGTDFPQIYNVATDGSGNRITGIDGSMTNIASPNGIVTDVPS